MRAQGRARPPLFPRAIRGKVNISLAVAVGAIVPLTPMKTLRSWLTVSLLLTCSVSAQENSPPPSPSLRSPAELEQLVAPIALYPDALIALILPATTSPTDIVLAARHLREFPNDRSQIEHRAWDESVKSLTSYPEIVTWMDENLDWVKQVGQSFATQPAEVMQAVQRLRAKARANGSLIDTPQQQILAEPGAIRIVPAQPDIIYVPRYEPEIVFVDRPVYPYGYGRPFFTFGVGVAVGSWLAFDCDWRRNAIWVGNRHRHWSGHDWRRPLVSYAPISPNHSNVSVVRQWQPPTMRAGFTPALSNVRPAVIARPTVIGTSLARSADERRSFAPGRRPEPAPAPASDVTAVTPMPAARPPINPTNRVRATPSFVAPPLPTAPTVATTVAPAVTPPPPRTRPPGDRSGPTDSNYRGHRNTVISAPPLSSPVAPQSAPVAVAAPTQRGNRYSPPPPSRVVPAPAPDPAPLIAPAAPAATPPAPPPPGRGDRQSGRRHDNF